MSEIVLHQKIGFSQGTPENWNRFYNWTEKAAVGGNPRAQLNYAYRLDSLGDDQSAIKFLHYAADAKYVPAMTELGKAYETGASFLSKDETMAEQLYRGAAQEGYAPAQTHLDRLLRGEPLTAEDWKFTYSPEHA
jgi:TPR repeat protein